MCQTRIPLNSRGEKSDKNYIFLGCENKETTFAAGVLGADKGMFLALCAEDSREGGSARKQALPGRGY